MLLVLSALLAGLAAVVAGRWMNARSAALEAGKQGVVTVAVAAMEIPLGTQLEARHVSTIEMLQGSTPEGVYNDPKALVGKVAKASILKGELLLQARFVDQGEGSTLASIVAPDMRAVTIRVDDVVGVGGFLLPGNRVDVVASRAEDGKAYAETVLSNVKVLAVDQSASTEENKPVVVRAVTIEVSPEGSIELMKARELGRLQLTLRNPLDETDTTKLAAKEAPAPRPVARPVDRPKAEPGVQVIRGTAVGGGGAN
jgi:pilus assembly protein CpaB